MLQIKVVRNPVADPVQLSVMFVPLGTNSYNCPAIWFVLVAFAATDTLSCIVGMKNSSHICPRTGDSSLTLATAWTLATGIAAPPRYSTSMGSYVRELFIHPGRKLLKRSQTPHGSPQRFDVRGICMTTFSPIGRGNQRRQV